MQYLKNGKSHFFHLRRKLAEREISQGKNGLFLFGITFPYPGDNAKAEFGVAIHGCPARDFVSGIADHHWIPSFAGKT
jgi:hypothetical protein